MVAGFLLASPLRLTKLPALVDANAYQAPRTQEPSARSGYTAQSLVLLLNGLTFGSFCLAWAFDVALCAWGLSTAAPTPQLLQDLVDQTLTWTGVGYYACALSFAIFAYRASRNARALGVTLRHSAGATIFWFIVPFANLFMPYQVMKELWSASSRRHSSASYLVVWWLSYLVFRIAVSIISAIGEPDGQSWDDLAVRDLWIGIPAVISGALAFFLLYDIHRRQNAFAETLS